MSMPMIEMESTSGGGVRHHQGIRSRENDQEEEEARLVNGLENGEGRVEKDEEIAEGKGGGCVCRKVEGNHFLVYGKPRGKKFPFHCLLGPDYCCSFVTITLITVPSVLLLMYSFDDFPFLISLTGFTSFVVCLGSFMLTSFSDPGIIKRQSRQQLERSMADPANVPRRGILCERCHVYRDPQARHCFDCDACIEEMDHHCPWTGKCIGKRNLQSFYVFLGSLLFHFIYVIIAANVWLAIDKNRKAANLDSPPPPPPNLL